MPIRRINGELVNNDLSLVYNTKKAYNLYEHKDEAYASGNDYNNHPLANNCRVIAFF